VQARTRFVWDVDQMMEGGKLPCNPKKEKPSCGRRDSRDAVCQP